MNSQPSVKNLADEAEFQLIVARENLQWLAALARAIARDAKDKGQDSECLLGLANYLDDTGFSGIDQAIDKFKSVSSNVAMRNDETKNESQASAEACS